MCHPLMMGPLRLLSRKPSSWIGCTVWGLLKLWMISHSLLLRLVSTAAWCRSNPEGVAFTKESRSLLLASAVDMLLFSMLISESAAICPNAAIFIYPGQLVTTAENLQNKNAGKWRLALAPWQNGGKSTTANRGYCTCNGGGSTCSKIVCVYIYILVISSVWYF